MSSKSDRSDRIKALRKRVTKDPYDAQAWESLVSEADRARRGPERNAELSAIYEELLAVFPTAVSTLQRDIRPPQCCRRPGRLPVATCPQPTVFRLLAACDCHRRGIGGSMPIMR
jgi:hypothetical protein